MKKSKELYNALKNILNNGDEVFPAIVKSVDKGNGTCDVEFDGLELGGIRLSATVDANTKGIKTFPAVDSIVLVQRLGEKEEYFVALYSEVEEQVTQIGGVVVKVDSGGVVIAKDNDNLLDALKLIVEAVSVIVVMQGNNPDYGKLNQALTKIENLLK